MAFRLTGRWAGITVFVILVLVVTVVLVINQSAEKSFNLNPINQRTQTPTGNESGKPTGNQTPSVNVSISNATNVSGIYVEPTIFKQFEEGKAWVRVWVILKSADNIQETISRLPTSEFKLDQRSVSSASFSGNITKRGLEILSSDPYVDKVYIGTIGNVQLDASTSLIAVRDAVWNLGFVGSTKTVCVIDTGIDYTHPDLGGCFGNGTDFSCKVIGGYDFYYDDGNPLDDHGHGTHVAGIISSSNTTYRGVAYDSKIVALKACNSAGGDCQDAIINKSIEWCLNNSAAYNISVINISIGNGGQYPPDCPQGLRGAIQNAVDAGIPVVVASGNNGYKQGISHPACVPGAISVGAVYDANIGSYSGSCTEASTKVDNITCFTNRGSNLSLLAPGCRINSTNYSGADMRDLCGTSQATPHISGVVALLLQLKPDLTSEQIRDVLNNTGKEIIDAGYSNLSFRRIDAYKAISAVQDSLLRVNTLSLINYSGLSHAFAFTTQNANLSNITNISWSIDLGDGTKINSTYNITQLLFHETALVRLKHNYSQNGIYIVNVSTRAGNLFHSKNITVFVGDVILYDLKQINISGRQRMFQFSIRNNKNINLTNLGWNMSFGDGTVVSNSQVLTLDNKTDVFFRIKYNYTSASPTGGFTVTANATNVTFVDSKNITVIVI